MSAIVAILRIDVCPGLSDGRWRVATARHAIAIGNQYDADLRNETGRTASGVMSGVASESIVVTHLRPVMPRIAE